MQSHPLQKAGPAQGTGLPEALFHHIHVHSYVHFWEL